MAAGRSFKTSDSVLGDRPRCAARSFKLTGRFSLIEFSLPVSGRRFLRGIAGSFAQTAEATQAFSSLALLHHALTVAKKLLDDQRRRC
jgi:hypothetical protein